MRPVIVISDRDNVATALVPLEAGTRVERTGLAVTVREPIPAGHKVALAAIAAGQTVVKYGSPIGVASQDIAEGAHVHTHNVASARGRGDLASSAGADAGADAPRLAEPPDREPGPAQAESAPPSGGRAQ